jgi:dissimilatory sulfite reductase (desulfoviridin) alpha/beta subunit
MLLNRSGWDDHLRQAHPAGHKPHHRLRIAVAACPNACSRPQICDIGLIACSSPAQTGSACTMCGRCLLACRESALGPEGDRVALDPARCVGCGACPAVCPTRALAATPPILRLLLGGHLGRHPEWAIELPLRITPALLEPVLISLIELLIRFSKPGETTGHTIRRTGIGTITRALEGAAHG